MQCTCAFGMNHKDHAWLNKTKLMKKKLKESKKHQIRTRTTHPWLVLLLNRFRRRWPMMNSRDTSITLELRMWNGWKHKEQGLSLSSKAKIGKQWRKVKLKDSMESWSQVVAQTFVYSRIKSTMKCYHTTIKESPIHFLAFVWASSIWLGLLAVRTLHSQESYRISCLKTKVWS